MTLSRFLAGLPDWALLTGYFGIGIVLAIITVFLDRQGLISLDCDDAEIVIAAMLIIVLWPMGIIALILVGIPMGVVAIAEWLSDTYDDYKRTQYRETLNNGRSRRHEKKTKPACDRA